MPGLLEDFDNLCSSDSPPGICFSTLSLLRARAIDLINSLFHWRWDWERQNAQQVWLVPCTIASCSPLDTVTNEPIHATLFQFSTFAGIAHICSYNGTLTSLLNLAHDIWGDDSYLTLLDRSTPIDLLRSTRRSPLCLPSDPELSLQTAAAEQIRTIELPLSQESHVSSRALILLSSLRETYRVLPMDDPLRHWIRRICSRSGKADGVRAGETYEVLPMDDPVGDWVRLFRRQSGKGGGLVTA